MLIKHDVRLLLLYYDESIAYKKAEMTKINKAVNYNLHDWLIHSVSLSKFFED